MEDSGNWFEKGVTLFEHQNYPGAITAFEKAITFNQFPADAWFNRGLVLAEMGKYRQALESIDEALSLNPGHENARIARTMVLARMENVKNTDNAAYTPTPSRRTNASLPATPATVSPPGTVPIRNPILAAIFSFFFPGWGQWYNGRRWDGLFFLVATFLLGIINIVALIVMKSNFVVTAVFMVLGLSLLVFGMKNAYETAERINRREIGFTRKSRLFWLPVALLIAMVVILVASIIIAFMVFGMAGNTQNALGNSYPAGGNAHTTKIVAATVNQPDSGSLIVTYHGGPDAEQVSQVIVTVTDAAGSVQTKTLGKPGDTVPLAAGTSTAFSGSFVGKDHVLATAKFMDGTNQVILDSVV